jgi:hypothetical protein
MSSTNEASQPSNSAADRRPVSPEKRFNQFLMRTARGSQARSAADEAVRADYDLLWARAEADRILKAARLEASELLTKTIAIVEKNTALTAAAREEQESNCVETRQALLEAERELSMAREVRANAERQLAKARATSAEIMAAVEAECQRQLVWARTASQAEFMASHRELAEGLLPICDAFVEVCGGLDRFIKQADGRRGGSSVTIDVRQGNGSVAAGSSRTDLDAPASPAPLP